MRVLVACEFSGVVAKAFRDRGHDAWLCDLRSTEREGWHIHGDVRYWIDRGNWDLMIAHPDCTHLAVSGAKHFAEKRADGRQQATIRSIARVLGKPYASVFRSVYFVKTGKTYDR